MEKLEALKKARELIKDKKHWCDTYFARTESGIPIPRHIQSTEAYSFCAIGALLRVTGHGHQTLTGEHRAWLRPASLRLGYHDPADLNNNEGHEKTLEMFDLAICMEECNLEELV